MLSHYILYLCMSTFSEFFSPHANIITMSEYVLCDYTLGKEHETTHLCLSKLICK